MWASLCSKFHFILFVSSRLTIYFSDLLCVTLCDYSGDARSNAVCLTDHIEVSLQNLAWSATLPSRNVEEFFGWNGKGPFGSHLLSQLPRPDEPQMNPQPLPRKNTHVLTTSNDPRWTQMTADDPRRVQMRPHDSIWPPATPNGVR